ncbi:MAG: hypothetical protein ACP5U0_08850 [Caldisphaera sp.]
MEKITMIKIQKDPTWIKLKKVKAELEEYKKDTVSFDETINELIEQHKRFKDKDKNKAEEE